jgi:hypothetical protein
MDCHPSIDILIQCGLSSNDVEKVVNDGKSFLDFFPGWKETVLWEQWRLFGIKCFSEGITCIGLSAMHLHMIQRSTRTLLFQIVPGLSIRRFPLQRMQPGALSFHTSPLSITLRRRWCSPCLGSTAPHISVSSPSFTVSSSLTTLLRIHIWKASRENFMDQIGDQPNFMDHQRLHSRGVCME